MADRSVNVRLKLDISDFQRGVVVASASASSLGKNLGGSGRDIDKFSGRLRLLGEAAFTLGPALIPLGASVIPVLTASLAGLGAAAGGIGAAVLAFNGMGDALTAIDEARLEPTTENLAKMRDTLTELGPAGADFARYLDQLRPAIDGLQDTAREGLFPGLQEGLDALMERAPEVERIIGELATGMGNLAEDAGKGLASEAWTPFFDYVEQTARPTLEAFGEATGNVVLGLANMLVALDPLTQDFARGLVDATQRFADWSAGLGEDQGFQRFMAYIRESGPQAVEFIGAIAQAFGGLLEAAAPLGQAILPVLTQMAQVFATIASSDIGPVLYTAAAAMIAFNRAALLTSKATAAMSTSLGPWGLAVGASAGLVLEFKSAYDELRGAIDGVDAAIRSGSIPELEAQLASAKEQLDGMNEDAQEVSFAESMLGGFAGLTDIKQGVGAVTGATDELGDSIATGEKALENLRNGIPTLVDPLRGLVAATQEAIDAEQEQADAILETVSAMRAKREEALRNLNAELNYQAAIDDANAALKENGKTVDKTTEKGRDNLRNLYALAAGWNGQSDAAKNATGSLRAARQNFIATADAMDMPIGQAKRLADRLFEIKSKKVTVEATVKGQGAVDTLNAALSRAVSKTITLTVNRVGDALGGLNYAGGGYTGDGGRDEPAGIVHRGEVVIPQTYVKRDWSMLKGRYGDLPGFAGGGPVGGQSLSQPGGRGGSDVGDAIQIFVAGAWSAQKALKALKVELEASQKSLEREKQQRDDLIAASEAFASAVGAAYAKADPFSGGLSDFDLATEANTNDSNAAKAALEAAAAQGLDGPLYQALAASGNLLLLQEFAALSAEEIARREGQFAGQSNAQGSLGQGAANQVYAQAIKDQTKELREAQQERKRLASLVKRVEDRLDRLPDKVEDGARKGISEREKRVQSKVRTG